MTSMLFVNLPVADPGHSREFFTALGFRFDDMFCDEGTICMIVNGAAMVLLHRWERFAGYVAGQIGCPRRGQSTVLAITVEDRADVDRYADTALELGGTPLRDPEDLGFMYCRSFCDLDGHAWEAVWLDPGAICGDS